MIWLRESCFVPDKNVPETNGAKCQPGQPPGVFHLTRLFQFTRTSYKDVPSKKKTKVLEEKIISTTLIQMLQQSLNFPQVLYLLLEMGELYHL
jgi:hypothetical protein